MAKAKKRKNIALSCSKELVVGDDNTFRQEKLEEYERRKKVLERIEAQILEHEVEDVGAFQIFLANKFGVEQSRIRELAELNLLAQMRHDKLEYLANHDGVSCGVYCYEALKKLNSIDDFWDFVEQDLQRCAEEDRVRQEAEQFLDEDWESDWDFDDSFDDCGDDDFEGMFESAFGNGFNISSEINGMSSDDEVRELKKLYRELCLRFHPDKIGSHDGQKKHIWESIQEAYNSQDLLQLRRIKANLAFEDSSQTVRCSDIIAMIQAQEWTIRVKRTLLSEQKRGLIWGFAKWSDSRKRQAAKEIAVELEQEIDEAEYILNKVERKIKRFLAYKPRKKSKKEN